MAFIQSASRQTASDEMAKNKKVEVKAEVIRVSKVCISIRGEGMGNQNKKPTTTGKVDQREIDYVKGAIEPTMKSLRMLAADKRLTAQAKQGDAQQLVRAGVDDIRERKEQTVAGLQEKAKKLRNAGRLSVAPAPELVGQLEYARAALEARWRSVGWAEMKRDWQIALDAGDLVTARVYRDFAGAALRRKMTPPGKPVRDDMVLGSDFEQLASASEELLLTPEQKKARSDLTDCEATMKAVEHEAFMAVQQLENARVNHQTGEVYDQARADQTERIRAMM